MNDPAVPPVHVLAIGVAAGDLAVLASVGVQVGSLDPRGDLVEEIVTRRPDAIIVELEQRGASGVDLCGRLKADPRCAGVPVLLISASDTAEARRRAYLAGCDDFVEKPFDRALLGHRLRSFARLRRAWHE